MGGGDQERLARILDEYLVGIERGLPLTPEELLSRYPDDAAQLRGYLSGLQLFHDAAGVTPGRVQRSLIGVGLPRPMQTIGDYQLIREIGRGGMGVVYEAIQHSLRRRVALKILPFSIANDAKQLSRFKNEAQAAAQVQHPNIVPVYSVGEENGIHYYVMQLIDGQALTSLLDGLRSGTREASDVTPANDRDRTLASLNGLSREPRNGNIEQTPTNVSVAPMRAAETADHVRVIARLAKQAAEALYAAHEYGVVHRDVKPSNLLLDDHGKLWVTDFGLARCRENQGLTQTGDVLGTMRYMSPEQALGRAAMIDHRTDIYSLGITMYELATLHHPADEASNLQVYFDRKNQAPKPLRAWNHHIPRDFQTIVLKCLGEFPNERYETAKALAEDLGWFLDGHPILASPPSWLTRAGKWAKRHRPIVYAAAAVFLIAIVTTIASVVAISREKLAQQEHELLVTRSHMRDTHTLLDRLAALSDQLATIPGAEGVRQKLLQDCSDLYSRFQADAAGDPALAADLAFAYSKLGSLSEKMKKTGEAIEAHEKARDVWQQLAKREPSNADYARNLALSENNLGLILAQNGRSAEGFALLRKASESQAELLSAVPESNEVSGDLGTNHTNLGLVLGQTGAKKDALDHFAAAIARQEEVAAGSSPSETLLHSLAASYNNFASLQAESNTSRAGDAYKKAIDIQQKLVKADPVNRIYQADLARTYSNLGYLSTRAKDWKNAESCYSDAIAIQEQLVKASPLVGTYQRDLAISYNNLGMAQSRAGRLTTAEASLHKAINLQTALLSVQPNDPEMLSNQGSAYNNLAMLSDREQRMPEAEKAYRQAIADQRRAFEVAPSNDRYRALLSQHCLNFAHNLNNQAKYEQAMQVALERKKLWTAKPSRLYSVAQQLAATYGLMHTAKVAQQAQLTCLHEAVEALRDAYHSGLPPKRLEDSS